MLGGALTICAGLTSAELATAIPETGGAVKYIEYTYGKLAGFLLGWAQSIIYYPANISALSIIFSTQLINLFHLSANLLIPIAILAGTSITIINLLGTKLLFGPINDIGSKTDSNCLDFFSRIIYSRTSSCFTFSC